MAIFEKIHWMRIQSSDKFLGMKLAHRTNVTNIETTKYISFSTKKLYAISKKNRTFCLTFVLKIECEISGKQNILIAYRYIFAEIYNNAIQSQCDLQLFIDTFRSFYAKKNEQIFTLRLISTQLLQRFLSY